MPISVLIIDVSSVIFGITALILASRARTRLTQGAIRKYIDNFSVCLSFVVVFSVWRAIRDFVFLNEGMQPFLLYPEYIFIIFTYIAFIVASYRVVLISHEFGFKKEGQEIKKILREKK